MRPRCEQVDSTKNETQYQLTNQCVSELEDQIKVDCPREHKQGDRKLVDELHRLGGCQSLQQVNVEGSVKNYPETKKTTR
jgi:hypothetical protein